MQDKKEKDCYINKHIPEETWKAFVDNTLPSAAYLELLEHTGSCIRCAERLSVVMGQGPMAILPPAYLKDQIRDRIGRLPIQRTVPAKRVSPGLQLFWYGLKVSGAMAMALIVLLFTGAAQWNDGPYLEVAQEKPADVLLSAVDQAASDVTDQMSVFANRLLDWNFDDNGGQ